MWSISESQGSTEGNFDSIPGKLSFNAVYSEKVGGSVSVFPKENLDSHIKKYVVYHRELLNFSI